MDNLYWLDHIRSQDLICVGWKVFHLSQLLQKGYPVLPGFVLSAEVWQSVLATIDWSDSLFADLPSSPLHLDIDNPRQLQAIARQLRQAIHTALVPKPLLQEFEAAISRLRSPAIILRPSFLIDSSQVLAGQSELAVKTSALVNSQVCSADSASFAHSLKQLWGDFVGAKSLFYWQRLGIGLPQVRMAVLVQPIQPAIASGTVLISNTQFEIRATVGLGMAIERGEVVPDIHQVDVATGEIQTQLGQKSIAYGLPNFADASTRPPGSAHAAAPTTAIAEAAILQTHLLDDQQQSTSALIHTDLHQLIQLARSAAAESTSGVKLEWVLTEATKGLYLTQMIPLVDAFAPKLIASQAQSVTSLLPNRSQPKAMEVLPNAKLIATGLSASSGQAIAQASVITDFSYCPTVPPHTVLVVSTLPLEWMPLVQQAAALVTEQGGMTSHSAIVAREMGIPAVMGVGSATQQIQSGEMLWVDGDRGKIYRLATSNAAIMAKPPSTFSTAPALSIARNRTQLMVNASQPAQALTTATLPVDGVGLLRAELLAASVLESHPALWVQQHTQDELVERMAAAICQFAAAFNPRPVFYRSFDLRAHEFHATNIPASKVHPMLGMRGTFSYVTDATLFNAELLALAAAQQAGYTNLRLLLPFVRSIEEFEFCRHLVEQAGLMQHPDFRLWMMAEVPSVLLLLPEYVGAGVQGISIGTNDLTQLLLGVDRDQVELASAFDERHLAVQRAIAHLIQQAQALEIPCSICGEAPAHYPDLIPDLIRWGITSISVAPAAVDATHRAIAQAEHDLLDL